MGTPFRLHASNNRVFPTGRPNMDFCHAPSASSAATLVAPSEIRGTKSFRHDVLRGLRSDPKRIPSKYLYDALGSQLFDEICTLEEYYPTRVE